MNIKTYQAMLGAIFLVASAPGVRAAIVEVVPMVGYQINGFQDLAGPRYDRLDLKNVPLRGISIGYMNDEDGELELSWTRAFSAAQVQRSGGLPPDRFDVRIDQLHINGLYMFSNESLQPFILIGAGATRYTPDTTRSKTTQFSLAMGGGLKWIWSDHLGLRFDIRWNPALVLPGSHYFCDETGSGECYSTQDNSLLGRAIPLHGSVEFISGLLLRY